MIPANIFLKTNAIAIDIATRWVAWRNENHEINWRLGFGAKSYPGGWCLVVSLLRETYLPKKLEGVPSSGTSPSAKEEFAWEVSMAGLVGPQEPHVGEGESALYEQKAIVDSIFSQIMAVIERSPYSDFHK